jgi:hypothetical protein
MAHEIINSLRSRSVVRVTGNTPLTIELTDLSKDSNVETILSATITHAMSSSDGKWTIQRGGSTGPVVLVLFGENDIPFIQHDIAIANNSTSNIYITNSGTDGTLILQLSKTATYTYDLDLGQ